MNQERGGFVPLEAIVKARARSSPKYFAVETDDGRIHDTVT